MFLYCSPGVKFFPQLSVAPEIASTFSSSLKTDSSLLKVKKRSWQDKEGDFPDISIRAIMVNPLNSNEVIIGTDLGVWGTDNFSDVNPNWHQAYNGMKDVPVHSFDLRTADNTVLAATHGRGLFTGQFTSEPSTLSIDNIEFDEAFSVYPTVSKGNITVFAKSSLGKVKMNIFDIYH